MGVLLRNIANGLKHSNSVNSVLYEFGTIFAERVYSPIYKLRASARNSQNKFRKAYIAASCFLSCFSHGAAKHVIYLSDKAI